MKPASKSLIMYGQAQRIFMLLLVFPSALFWTVARYYDTPILPVEHYGEYILSVNAEVWIAPVFIGSSVHLLAQVVNGDSRLPAFLTPLVRVISSLMCSVALVAFSAGVLYVDNIDPYFVYSFEAGLVTLWISWLGAGDLWRGVKSPRSNRQ